jgi:hypothetical protein
MLRAAVTQPALASQPRTSHSRFTAFLIDLVNRRGVTQMGTIPKVGV